MTAFSISVSERPPVRLYGMNIATDMANALKNCSHLWEHVFAPRMQELGGKPSGDYQGPSYGVSVMLDADHFTYWAAMPAKEHQTLPDSMGELSLAGGLYAGGSVSSLEQLGLFYQYLYAEWTQQQTEYAINMQGCCFEYYDDRYCTSGAFEVYAPVIRL